MTIIPIHPENPESKKIQDVAFCISSGGIVICPTDTNYAIVCKLSNRSGIEQICKLVGKKPDKANLSIICSDLKHISDFTLQFSKSIYKMMNRNLPGPFTFILNANNKVPKLFLNKKKTIGIRVPDNEIINKIVEYIDEPLVCSSVNLNEDSEYDNQIDEIELMFKNKVDIIIDSGNCPNQGSGVVDCTAEEPVIIREGFLTLE